MQIKQESTQNATQKPELETASPIAGIQNRNVITWQLRSLSYCLCWYSPSRIGEK
jgi:hypothetical protein